MKKQKPLWQIAYEAYNGAFPPRILKEIIKKYPEYKRKWIKTARAVACAAMARERYRKKHEWDHWKKEGMR